MLTQTLSRRLDGLFLSTLFLIVILCGGAPAQAPANDPDRGAKLGNAYAIGDFEIINTTNGNLMLNFPLATLPPGRGEVGGGVSLVYNSKLWDIKTEKIEDHRGSPRPPFFDKTVIHASDSGGWSITPGVTRIEYEDRRQEYGGALPSCPSGQGDEIGRNLTYVYKVSVVLPDGSKHEMVPTGYTDTPVLKDGFYKVSHDGWIENCGGARTRTGHPMVYHSIDGTFLRLEYSYDGDTDPTNNTWMLYMPDGMRYDGTRLYDRNGNYVTITATGVADQFGRGITITEPDGNTTLVTSKGTGGENVVWTVKWKRIAVLKNYQSCEPHRCTPDAFRSPLQQSLRVVDRIIQPRQLGGREYVFTYNAADQTDSPAGNSYGWGEISSIELPTGAKVEYEYVMDGQDGPEQFFLTSGILKNYPTKKTVTYALEHDGASELTSDVWTYSIAADHSTVTSPEGSQTTDLFGPTDGNELPWYSGLSLQTRAADGTVTERRWARNFPTACSENPCQDRRAINPYVDAEFTSKFSVDGQESLTSLKTFSYDKNGNVTETREYDWMPGSMFPRSGGFINSIPSGVSAYLRKISRTEFYNDTPAASAPEYQDADAYHLASSPRLLRLPKVSETLNGGGVPVSRAEMQYDHMSYGSNTIGGNLTSTRSWDSFKDGISRPYSTQLSDSNSIRTSTLYNSYGLPEQSTDANGNVSYTEYGPIAGAPGGLYPTRTISAYGTNIARTSTNTYDFHTGSVLSTRDEDNGVLTISEYDAFGRNTLVRNAVADPSESWVRTEYDDNSRLIITRSDIDTAGDGRKVSIQHFDQLGRIRLDRKLENAATEDPRNERDGIKVQTRHKIVDGFTYQLVSNPYQSSVATEAGGDGTMGWTLTTSWQNGRRQSVETFDGSELPQPWGANDRTTGAVTTDMDLNRTTTTDQAGRKRRSISDAFGRLTRVDEPNDSGEIGTPSAPTQPTSYSYDALGNLVKVNQGVQNRYFLYDSLGRLVRLRQPEQTVNPQLSTVGNTFNNDWTTAFVYDGNGNTRLSRDARNVSIDITYDALNRQLRKSYSDSTPAVAYSYDESSVPRSKGKLTRVLSSASEMRYLAYDANGKFTSTAQVIDGRSYQSFYEYDLAGTMRGQTYPSGRQIRTFVEPDGNISSVASRLAYAPFKNYATSVTYTSSGKIKHLQLGNGLWESAEINSRGQATAIRLGSSPTDGGTWQLGYQYGELDSNGNVDESRNTGNIAKHSISVDGVQAPLVQTYRYDSLYRIRQASETVQGNRTWSQSFQYDRYGNRTALSLGDNGQPEARDQNLPVIESSRNRFQSGQGYTYDQAGNIIGDPSGRTFVFNAENKQTEIRNAQGVAIGRYDYDGSGNRVRKVTAEGSTEYLYNGFGRLIAEMSTAAALPGPTVNYTATDPLGSPRVITNKQGQVIARRDFKPFGEEIGPDSTVRNAARKYGLDDTVSQKFTTYQRDDESGLDFAEARYYNPNHGRFTAVDPLVASGKSDDPQTFNRYVYALNRPTIFTDPTGLQTAKDPVEFAGGEETEIVEKIETVVIGAERERVLALAVGKALSAGYGREQTIARSAAGTRSSETRKSIIKDLAESFDPTLNLNGSATGPSGGVSINLGSPARALEGLLTATVDTSAKIAANRIATEEEANTALGDADMEYQSRGIEAEEIVRSLEASAKKGIEMYKNMIERRPQITVKPRN